MKIEYLQNLNETDIAKAQTHIRNSIGYAEDFEALFYGRKFLTQKPELVREHIIDELGMEIENPYHIYANNPYDCCTEVTIGAQYFLIYNDKDVPAIPAGAVKFNPLLSVNVQSNVELTLFSAYRNKNNYVNALNAVCGLIEKEFRMQNIIIDSHDALLDSAIESVGGHRLNRVYNIKDNIREEYNRYVIFFDSQKTP